MANTKFYVVWAGRKPGVYSSWPECQTQINNYKDAKYKAFPSRAEAETAFAAGWKKYWGKGAGSSSSKAPSRPRQLSLLNAEADIDYDSISVDVGTRGNPGPVEYKGVDTQTGEVLFSQGPISKGTNNLGEFLAIVHALAYLQKLGSRKTVYSDSVNAIKWVRQKAVATTLARDESTREIWALVDRAVQWLHTNTYENKVLKWRTELWGEIKADYGRK